MTNRSRAGRVRPVLAAVALAAPLVLASSASAAPRQALQYDALGDSYASGYGVPPYSQQCGRSQASYAAQVDGHLKWAA